MRNIKLTVEYDGTSYHGWQSQLNANSVQDTLTEAIKKLTGEEIKLNGAGRTDAGVHALGQVANFHTEMSIPGEKFAYAINNLLPDDITIKRSEEVEPDFHARFSATGKRYLYKIYNDEMRSALLHNRAFHVNRQLSLEKMRQAAAYFIGTHDFVAFRATGSSVKTTVRTVWDLSLEKNDGIIKIDISGNGFLYNMVRIIAGTLVEVGCGKINAGDVPGIITGQMRGNAGRTAPAHGLYLLEVMYDKVPDDNKSDTTDD